MFLQGVRLPQGKTSTAAKSTSISWISRRRNPKRRSTVRLKGVSLLPMRPRCIHTYTYLHTYMYIYVYIFTYCNNSIFYS